MAKPTGKPSPQSRAGAARQSTSSKRPEQAKRPPQSPQSQPSSSAPGADSPLSQAVREVSQSQAPAKSVGVAQPAQPAQTVKKPIGPSLPNRTAAAEPVAASARAVQTSAVATASRQATGATASAVAEPAGDDRLSAFMERAAQEALAVTYWFEPAPQPHPYSLTVRFVGRRMDVEGDRQQGDAFIQEETIDEVVPGSGPVSLTAKVRGVNTGQWEVTATPLGPVARGPMQRAAGAPQTLALPAPEPKNPLDALWRRYAPPAGSQPFKTRLEPFLRVPGAVPFSWITLVLLGMVVAVATQALLLARAGHEVGPALLSTLLALGAGAVGGKIWYVVKHWDERSFIGWAIQGFITGAAIGAGLLYLLTHVSIGSALDAVGPGLMFGLAIGRIGCFFAGCCGGPATAARWGVWSSDQRVGARRVPTQLIESGTSLVIGLVTLAALLAHGAANGAFFAIDVAAYTLAREGILRMRSEPLRRRFRAPLTAIAATLVIVAALVVIVR